MAHTHHPNSIFRWEDAASLEHACWFCLTKANSPRALQTCYGVHSIPCVSYHPTMHAIGATHRCSGCINTREMHDKRHYEIAVLMVKYRKTEEVDSLANEMERFSMTPTRNGKGVLVEITGNAHASGGPNRRGGAGAKHRNSLGHGNAEELGIIVYEEGEDGENNNEVGKENKVLSVDEADADPEESEVDDDDDDDDDTASLSSYAPSSTDHTSTPTPNKKPTKAQLRAEKKAKKSAKATSKALKNKSKNLVTVTSAEIEKVAQILHGDESDTTNNGSAHPLATDKTVEDVIKRNLGFVKNIQAHKADLFASIAKGRKEVKERRKLKKNSGEETVEMEGVVSAIMIKLGVSPGVVAASAATATSNTSASTPLRCAANGYASGKKQHSTPTSAGSAGKCHGAGSGTSRASVAIAVKLRNAIKIDLEKHENEIHARYIRAGGFWRYVGKSVFDNMTSIASDIDVATGEKWDKKSAREGKNGAANGNDAGEQADCALAEE